LAGGYPEWLDYCEDLVFDLALKRRGCSFEWSPKAVARFRPRSNVRRFFVQYYRYARGDGKALLWTRRHLIRYATYLGAPALLRLTAGHPLALTLIGLGGVLYCRRPYLRLARSFGELSVREQIVTIALIPVLRLIGDLAKMAGYPVGLIWSLKRVQRRACSPISPSATLPKPEYGTT
jgi:hypothetical protein